MPDTKLNISHLLSHPIITAVITGLILSGSGWFLGLRDIIHSYEDHVKQTRQMELRIQSNTDKVSKIDNVELRLALLEESNKNFANNMNQTNIAMGIMQNDVGHVKSDLSEVKQSNSKILEILTKN